MNLVGAALKTTSTFCTWRTVSLATPFHVKRYAEGPRFSRMENKYDLMHGSSEVFLIKDQLNSKIANDVIQSRPKSNSSFIQDYQSTELFKTVRFKFNLK